MQDALLLSLSIKNTLVVVLLLIVSVACDSANVSIPIKPQVIYSGQIGQGTSYRVQVISADVFDEDNNVFILTKFKVYGAADVSFKLFAPIDNTYSAINLPDSENEKGSGPVDISIDKLGQVYIPFNATGAFRVYRYSESMGIKYVELPRAYTEGIIDEGVMALKSRTGEVSLMINVDQLFTLKNNSSNAKVHSLSIGQVDSLHDIQVRENNVFLVVQSADRKEFWSYLINRDTGEVKAKVLIKGIDFLAKLSIVSIEKEGEVIIAEKRNSVARKKINTGFIRIDMKNNITFYDKVSPKTDGKLAIDLACMSKDKEMPVALYAERGNKSDSLYLASGENETYRFDMPEKTYFKQLLIVGNRHWRTGLAVYESIHDYDAYPYISLLPIQQFISCEN